MRTSPTSAEERIAVLDILRGVALLGILIANLPVYSHPPVALMLGQATVQWGSDAAATLAVRFFVEGKFYCLLSLLFGFGFSLQVARAEARGVAFVALYARRLIALWLIGAAHLLLVWTGDILTTYAVLGSVLLAFRRRRPGTILVCAVLFLVVPLLIDAASMLWAHGRAHGDPAAASADRVARLRALVEDAWRVYGHGSFWDVTRQRARDYLLMLSSLRIMAPSILCMFLVGLWVARRGVLNDLVAHRQWIRRVFTLCLPAGLAANALLVIARSRVADGDVMWRFAFKVALSLGGPLLCFAYASGIALLVLDHRWRQRLRPVGAAGSMALTNYLTQSIVCTGLFYGYGAGLLGQLGTTSGVLLAVTLWTTQVALSALWLRRYHRGPAEWLWRLLTYLRIPPMRRQ